MTSPRGSSRASGNGGRSDSVDGRTCAPGRAPCGRSGTRGARRRTSDAASGARASRAAEAGLSASWAGPLLFVDRLAFGGWPKARAVGGDARGRRQRSPSRRRHLAQVMADAERRHAARARQELRAVARLAHVPERITLGEAEAKPRHARSCRAPARPSGVGNCPHALPPKKCLLPSRSGPGRPRVTPSLPHAHSFPTGSKKSAATTAPLVSRAISAMMRGRGMRSPALYRHSAWRETPMRTAKSTSVTF